jgi:hypothetical protein
MKLLPAIVAVAKAQFDLPDLSNFDLSAFGLGPGTPLDFPTDAADEERYFFTTTTTTPPTPTPPTTPTTTQVPGEVCWKCDQMTYTGCASQGHFEVCELGDVDCCFVEIREKYQGLQQLCTGCKDATACEDNQEQNFMGVSRQYHQCRPDYRLQHQARGRGQQSVCRQCFNKCNTSTGLDFSMCFGSIENQSSTPNVMLTLHSDEANYPWSGAYVGGDFTAFGIPTGGRLDSGTLSDATAINEITTFGTSPETRNIYFRNAADGKVDLSNGVSGREQTEMTYWGLHGASQAWWSSNLKGIQDTLKGKVANTDSITTAHFQ